MNNRAIYARPRAFSGIGAQDRAFSFGQFVRAAIFERPDAQAWCRQNGMSFRAQAEGANSAGGVLVPDEIMGDVIALREAAGIFRQQCRVVPMGRDTLNWPRRTGGLAAYFTAEGGTLTASQAAFDNVELTCKKLSALALLSTEIAEDAVINLADYVASELAYAFASKEDDCGFNGDGTSTYGGIRGLTVLAIDGNHNAGKYVAATGHNTFASLDAVDLTGLMGSLPQYALPNARWYVSQMGFATCFARLIATAGGNSVLTLDGKIVYQFLGFPIAISQKLPAITTTLSGKAMMFFGDLSLAAALGERRGVTVRRLNERYADSDQVGIMGTERFDINVHDMGDNTSAGPLVSLVAP